MNTCDCDCDFSNHHFSSHLLPDGGVLNRLTCHDHPDCAEEHHDAAILLARHGVAPETVIKATPPTEQAVEEVVADAD